MKKALLILLTLLTALIVMVSCDNSVDYPFDDDVPAVETPEMVPLTFEFIKDGLIEFKNIPEGMKYSRNSGAKQLVEGEIRVEAGDRIKLFATRTSVEAGKYLNINCSSDCYVYGNVMSLIQEEGFAEKKDVFPNAFRELFKENTHIIIHNSKKFVLPATTLAESCYQEMFKGCTSLVTAPILPAKTLVNACYNSMFLGCSNLSYINCLAVNPNSNSTTDWVEGVAIEGLFEKADGIEWEYSNNGIPINWCTDPKYIPLTLEFIQSGQIKIKNRPDSLKYTINEGKKQIASDTIDVQAGERIRLYATRTSVEVNKCLNINCTSDCYIYGNVMSLISEENFESASLIDYAFRELFYGNKHIINHSLKKLVLPATTLATSCYGGMFSGCTGLTTAPKLPATTLANYCYSGMFKDCTINNAPELPATTLASGCYSYMFYRCESLIDAPNLPATTLANDCYWGMFEECTNLTNAPEQLPATTLTDNCYREMFFLCKNLKNAPELPAMQLAPLCYAQMFLNCESLIKAPELPATTLVGADYYEMFSGCTSLTHPPKLPATNLAEQCYTGMFRGCENLLEAPELPATNLEPWCYMSMFIGCEKIKTAPELPATTLADYCYKFMFIACKSLTTAPELPATTLHPWCYDSMFYECTSLTTAPELPATSLAEGCYTEMFYGCSNLNSITCLATDITAPNCTQDWVSGVPYSGTFTKAATADWSGKYGYNGIPYGWTVINQ